MLGLLHASCAHCHNQQRPADPGPRCYNPQNDIDLALNAATLGDFSQTGLSRTVVGKTVKPGDAAGSKLFTLYSHRGGPNLWGPSQMPPLATKKVNEVGTELLGDWINGL